MENNIWVEKYRPREFKEVIGIPESIVSSVSNDTTNHLLLTGTAGTGKTTTSKIILDRLTNNKDRLVLNASNDRGIDVIREKVKSFAMTNSSSGNIKIVFLDEADYLTKDAQASLRNLMEEYSNTCRFILTGNEENKIIDALKSRCSHFKFTLPKKEEIINRVKYISEQEKLNITDDAIKLLVDKYFPDIRKIINVLQSYSDFNKQITKEHFEIEKTHTEQIFSMFNSNEQWSKIRQYVLDNNLDYPLIINEMVNYVINKKPNNSIKILLILLDMNRYINSCANPEIEFSVSLLKIQKEVRGN